MFKLKHNNVVPLLLWPLILVSAELYGQTGLLDQDAARVCMDVAVRAEITGLDDIKLSTSENSGARDGDQGASYTGIDSFFLESNAPVRVFISAAPLSNGLDTLETLYEIDRGNDSLETDSSGSHAQFHELKVSATLGAISEQLAGQYSSSLVLTVVPQIAVRSSCIPTLKEPEGDTVDELLESEIELDLGSANWFPGGSNLIDDPFRRRNGVSAVPEQFRRFIDQPNAEILFPLLIDYRLWLSDQSASLSEAASYWWMFPNPEMYQDEQ